MDLTALIAVVGATAAFMLVLGAGHLALAAGTGLRIRRRLGQVVSTEGRRPEERRRPFSARVVRPALSAIGRPFSRVAPGGLLTSGRDDLAVAGVPLGLGPVEFLGVRLGAAVAGAGVGTAALAVLPQDIPLAVAAPAGALVGFMLPRLALGAMIRRRKKAILRLFPSALDILAVSLEAGLRFDAAIAQVARSFKEPLAGEFRRLFVEFQMGRPRTEAMRDFASRTGLEEVSRFVEAIAQAESLGVSYSRVIQRQAAEIRERMRQRAQEVAREAPIKMTIPMVLFIFPALLIVILGPAVPRLTEVFSSPR